MALYHLLSIGADPSVLATRSDVLKRAGYLVSTATTESSARKILGEAGFDLVVVCHSLAAADRMKVIQAAQQATSSPKIVAIHRGEERIMAADASVHSLDGPDKLLETIAEVLGEGTSRVQKLGS
jgi:DNA-binding response OmpR family regulator